tara:strand:- start:360 stop:1211 length:852 start_codon:yes stop_codon:yes gene_type:complete
MDYSKLPDALQYTMEKSPEPREYQTDIDSTKLVELEDSHTGAPEVQDQYEAEENKIAEKLPDVSKPDLIPDDIFDKIQKKLVREKKKLNGRKPAPKMTKQPKKDESDYPPPIVEPVASEEEDEEVKQIKQAYVKFQQAPPKIRHRSPSPVKTYPEGTKLTKKGKPRKQLSEEAKENRRKALEKGRETRRRNMLAKKQASGESIQPVKKRPTSPINIPKVKAWTQDDLAESQFQAIVKYESLRKERKQKKKEAKAIEEQRQKIKNVVRREVSWQQTAGAFANCY